MAFIIPFGATIVRITGQFHAFGGAGNSIWVIFKNAFNFENWKNNHATQLV